MLGVVWCQGLQLLQHRLQAPCSVLKRVGVLYHNTKTGATQSGR